MLLNEEVLTIVHGKQIKYYESLGYNVYKRKNKHRKICMPHGTKILIKTKDLPQNSHTKILCMCDECGEILERTYQFYNISLHEGKSYCNNCANKILHSGENNPSYRKDKTNEERVVGRAYPEYEDFVKKVLARDKWTCQICGKNNHEITINVHHMNGYDWYKEGRTDETNAICLCEDCHKAFHSIYGCGGNTKEQFTKWSNNIELNLNKFNGEIPRTRWAYCIEDRKIIKNPIGNIHRCCKGELSTYHHKHYIYYDEYIDMDDEEIIDYVISRLFNINYAPVVCLNNKMIFMQQKDAKKYAKVSNVSNCCKGNQSVAGHDPITNEPLRWKYLKDYLIENNCTLDDYYKLIQNALFEEA